MTRGPVRLQQTCSRATVSERLSQARLDFVYLRPRAEGELFEMLTSNHGFVRLVMVGVMICSAFSCGASDSSSERHLSAGTGGGAPAPAGSGGSVVAGSSGASPVVDQPDGYGGPVVPVVPAGPGMFIMMDKSVSMGCSASNDTCDNMTVGLQPPPTRWSAATDAINAFLASPSSTGIGVGIGFFEGPDFCNAAAYAVPTVPIEALPGTASAISSALATNSPGGTTPTEPALAGAIEYAKAYTTSAPEHKAVVVFVTDGMPNGCNSTVSGAAAIAQAGYSGTPSVKTYVVGLGATAALDQIALAGSGGVDHYFSASGDVSTRLLTALETISKAIVY